MQSPGCQPDIAVLNAFYRPNGPRSHKSNLICIELSFLFSFHNKYFYTVGIFNCIILSIYFSFVFTVTYFYFVFTVTYFYTVVKISCSMLVASLIWYFNKIWGWFLNKVLNFKTICQWLYDLLTKTRYNLLEERMKELTCEQMVEYLRSWP